MPHGVDRDEIMKHMAANGVDTRPVFYCAHHMPMYETGQVLPIAEEISRRGISLPSFPALTDDEVRTVAAALREAIRDQSVPGSDGPVGGDLG